MNIIGRSFRCRNPESSTISDRAEGQQKLCAKRAAYLFGSPEAKATGD